MMVKIILLVLGVAVLATAEVGDHFYHDLSPADEVNRLSQDVSAAMSSALSQMLNRYKSRLTCQLKAVDEFAKKLQTAKKVELSVCALYHTRMIHTHTHTL